jgi:hypothetical protein
MPLSDKTYVKLAESITPEVVEYIYKNKSYYDFMLQIIPEALKEKLGKIDEDIEGKLSWCIMVRIMASFRSL